MLDSPVRSCNWVPAQPPRLTNRSELSSILQKLAYKAAENEGAWRAWFSHGGVRLFVTVMSMEVSRERGRPALNVSYYDDEGSLQDYGLRIQPADETWQQADSD
jgi:hypothetical protein